MKSELTSREKDIYSLLLKGWDARRIADEFGLSWTTVATHRQNILMKMECYNCRELMALRIKELEEDVVRLKKIIEE